MSWSGMFAPKTVHTAVLHRPKCNLTILRNFAEFWSAFLCSISQLINRKLLVLLTFCCRWHSEDRMFTVNWFIARSTFVLLERRSSFTSGGGRCSTPRWRRPSAVLTAPNTTRSNQLRWSNVANSRDSGTLWNDNERQMTKITCNIL